MVSAATNPEAIRAEVAELLGVGVDAVDPDCNLVGQGLDSIRMMTLAGRWRRLGLAIDFAALAASPTVEAWSALVSAAGAEPVPVEQPTVPDADAAAEAFGLAPMQHALWLGRQDEQQLGGVAGHLYVEFDGGPIDPARLRAAATGLVRRHPMLRVEFLRDGAQRISPAAEFPVVVHDFSDLDDFGSDVLEVVDQRLAEIRETKSHQQLDGQVLE
ncbi:MAG: phosphopantetheine-binding protein, partial [Mycobacterium sp.]